MRGLKFVLAVGSALAAGCAASAWANMAPPARLIARAPVELTLDNSKGLQGLVALAPGSLKNGDGVAVMVTCPERLREGSYSCTISMASPGGGRRKQVSVGGDNALALRGKLELAAESRRGAPGGTQSWPARAKCPEGTSVCTVALDDPEGKLVH